LILLQTIGNIVCSLWTNLIEMKAQLNECLCKIVSE
jgi:hypothetical protein